MASGLTGVYRLTFADWARFPNDGCLYELLDGELHVTPSLSVNHQRISRDLEFQLLQHLRATGLGEVFDAPIGVRLSDADVVEPDLVVVLKEHAHRIEAQAIVGAPDLVVEILSPGSARRDLVTKRNLYEHSGVPEYWIVDPEARAIEVLVLEGSNYERLGLYKIDDSLTSRLLTGLKIELASVFPR